MLSNFHNLNFINLIISFFLILFLMIFHIITKVDKTMIKPIAIILLQYEMCECNTVTFELTITKK